MEKQLYENQYQLNEN